MQALDASSIIYGWDNYPIEQFPSLWKWLSGEVVRQSVVISDVAMAEVRKNAPDCCKWLETQDIHRLPASNAILHKALEIKKTLEITDEIGYGRGVGENDIIIIATCAVLKIDLISNEARQKNLPAVKANMKIPAVCALEAVGVKCIDFRELIVQPGRVF